MSLRIHCRACRHPIEQPPATFYGPPDVRGVTHQDVLCRTCAKRIRNLYPALRERAQGDRDGRSYVGRPLVPRGAPPLLARKAG